MVRPTAASMSAGTGGALCSVINALIKVLLCRAANDRPAAEPVYWFQAAVPSRESAPSTWEIAPMPATHSSRLPAVPTINLASVVHGLDDYLRERGADP